MNKFISPHIGDGVTYVEEYGITYISIEVQAEDRFLFNSDAYVIGRYKEIYGGLGGFWYFRREKLVQGLVHRVYSAYLYKDSNDALTHSVEVSKENIRKMNESLDNINHQMARMAEITKSVRESIR